MTESNGTDETVVERLPPDEAFEATVPKPMIQSSIGIVS